MDTKLYVGNIPQHIREEDLRWLFSRTGIVVSVDLIRDPGTKKSKGFAFVEMISQGDAGKAVSEYNGYCLDENRLKVCVVQQSQKRSKDGRKSNRPSSSNQRTNRRLEYSSR